MFRGLPNRSVQWRLGALVVALLVAVTACGGDDDDTASGESDEPVETTEPIDDDIPAVAPDSSSTTDPDTSETTGTEPGTPEPGTSGPGETTMPSVPENEGIDDPLVVIADLDTAQVAPQPAEGDTVARFEARIETPGQLCAAFDTSLTDVDGVHVHIGAAGEVGETFIDLTPVLEAVPEHATVTAGCLEIDEATAAALEKSTDALYVDAHTPTAPDGAIRGQLRAASLFDLDLPR